MTLSSFILPRGATVYVDGNLTVSGDVTIQGWAKNTYLDVTGCVNFQSASKKDWKIKLEVNSAEEAQLRGRGTRASPSYKKISNFEIGRMRYRVCPRTDNFVMPGGYQYKLAGEYKRGCRRIQVRPADKADASYYFSVYSINISARCESSLCDILMGVFIPLGFIVLITIIILICCRARICTKDCCVT